MFLQNFWVGGGRPSDLRNFLQGGRSGDPTIWLRDLGDDPQYRGVPHQIPPHVGPPSCGNTAKERHDGAMLIPASGHRNGVGGSRGGGYTCPPPIEHHRQVYRNSYETGAISGGITVAGSMVATAVLVTGRYRPSHMGG